jgi:hypothetical protein
MKFAKALTRVLFLCTCNPVLADESVDEQAAPAEASGFVDALVNARVKALLRYSEHLLKIGRQEMPGYSWITCFSGAIAAIICLKNSSGRCFRNIYPLLLQGTKSVIDPYGHNAV